MRILMWVFVLFAIYGVATGHNGGALLSAGMAVFMKFSIRHYRQQDKTWNRNPDNASSPRDTLSALSEHDCESS